ncbi:MAG: enoyl-CoA hydratase-related protein [Candidatus Nanopelagicales bacterium]|nr:enoyl-CoA hydratase-related protein [Candidatus Nanopelagicales bacterium]
MTSSVQVTRDSGITLVSMQHGKVNALDLELLTEVHAVFSGLAPDEVVVLTGNGRAFSAGLDMRRLLDEGADYSDALLQELTDATLAIFRHPAPVVAAVEGAAIAGGALLAFATDYRMMAAGVIGLPELSVGVAFPPALLEVARYVMGTGLRMHLLGARAVKIDEALAAGFVDEVVAPEGLLTSAHANALELKNIPAISYALVKSTLHAPTEQCIANIGGNVAKDVAAAWMDETVRAGIRSQVERIASK